MPNKLGIHRGSMPHTTQTGLGRVAVLARKLAAIFVCIAMASSLLPAAMPAWAQQAADLSVLGTTFTVASGGLDIVYKVTAVPDANGEGGTVQVGDGTNPAADITFSGSIVIPQTVEHGGVAYTVTALAENSFRFTAASSASLPSTVTVLGKRAFYSAANLQSVDLGKDSQLSIIRDDVFCSPSATGVLRDFYFPPTVEWIGKNAFMGQAALTCVEVHSEYVDYLGECAFANCYGLTSITLPGLTASGYGIDFHVCYNCTNLETVTFLGTVEREASAVTGSETRGARTFECCSKLKHVVYKGRKYLPSWSYAYGGGASGVPSSGMGAGFIDNDPDLYVTVTYYPSQQSALEGKDALGYVRVRSDTPVVDIAPGMAAADEKGAIVWDGRPVEVPQGFSGWAYEGSPLATEAVDDSLYAYPVDEHDLGYASAVVAKDSFDYTGLDIDANVQVYGASGSLLAQGADYQVRYLRLDEDGNWQVTADLVSCGSLRAVITAAEGSSFYGETSVGFSIAKVQEGSTFVCNGVTYRVTAVAAVDAPGTVQVGDGSSLAIDAKTSGVLEIPQEVGPEGSLMRYTVTGVGNRAFGGNSAAEACTKLEQVVLPSTVTSLGTYSFGFCTGLTRMVIPSGVVSVGARAFQQCWELADLTFQCENLQQVGTYAFAYCSALTSLRIPQIDAARDHVFAYCTMLRRVDLLAAVPAEEMATRFVGCTRLSRIVCWQQAYPDQVPEGATVYYPVTFLDADGITELGTAVIAAGTQVSSLSADLPAGTVLEGVVPAFPQGCNTWAAKGEPVQEVASPVEVTATYVEPQTDPQPSSDDPGSDGQPGTEDPIPGSDAQPEDPSPQPEALETFTLNRPKVTLSALSSDAAKAATTIALGSKTRKIAAGAFADTVATKLVIKSAKLEKANVKGSLKGSKVAKVILKGAAKKKKTYYKKIFVKAVCGKKVTVS